VQLFEIVVIDILLMQSISYGLEVHLWLGLRTLFWLRVSLYLKYLLRSSVGCLLEICAVQFMDYLAATNIICGKVMSRSQRCIFVLRHDKVYNT